MQATHKVGVAGMVLNNDKEVLVIREARSVDGQKSGFGQSEFRNPLLFLPRICRRIHQWPLGASSLMLSVSVSADTRSTDDVVAFEGRGWKLPGGLADLGEEFATTAARETAHQSTYLKVLTDTDGCGVTSAPRQEALWGGRGRLPCQFMLTGCSYTRFSIIRLAKYSKRQAC